MYGLAAPIEERRYVVFQPDTGGWNNIRMALEIVIIFAKVTGRILVIPPKVGNFDVLCVDVVSYPPPPSPSPPPHLHLHHHHHLHLHHHLN
jgi:hypothetical protein